MRRPSMIAAILVGLAVLTAASSASAMYHPTVGRWAARDPDGNTGNNNLLEYCDGAPGLLVDPPGLSGASPAEYQMTTTTISKTAYSTTVRLDGYVRRQGGMQLAVSNTRTIINPCEVVLIVAHQGTVAQANFSAGEMAAVGCLTCWGDAHNYSVTTGGVGEPDKIGPPPPGVIPNMPHIKTTIGFDEKGIWGNRWMEPHGVSRQDQKTLGLVNPVTGHGDPAHGTPDLWNGGYGRSKEGGRDLYEAAKKAAKAEAQRLAEDCRCICDSITLRVETIGKTDFLPSHDNGPIDNIQCKSRPKTKSR